MFDQSLIDQVRENVDIVDVIQSYIPLKKAGSGFKALCPFHEEDTPSFNVSRQKQIFKCFGCGKSGNVFTFVQEYEKISFPEAMRRLAQRAGVRLPQQAPPSAADHARDALFRACELAAAFYRKQLATIGETAREYLEQRGIGEKTVEAFDIGYAPDDFQALHNYLREKSISDNDLIRAGLLRRNERGNVYDLLRHRLIFPIRNGNGRVVAFGGRVLSPDQQGGKYINSPTSDIYTKGEELYGLYQARYDIGKREHAVMCEGYTDLIRLHDSGFTHAVASLGTALTNRQLHLLGRYAKKIVLLYDGDRAGRTAAMKSGLSALQQGFDVQVCALPADQDPDSYLVEQGAEALQKLLDEAPSLPDFVNADSVMDMSRRTKVDVLRDAILRIDNALARELFAGEVAQAFGVSVTSLLAGGLQRRRKNNAEREQFFLAKNHWEQECIRFMMQHPELVENLCSKLKTDYFFDEIYRELYEVIARQPERLQHASSLLSEIASEDVRNLLGDLLMDEAPVLTEPEMVALVRQRKAQLDLRRIEEALTLVSQDSVEFTELLRRKKELQQELHVHDRRKVTKTLF
ncbi:MAG: DNA primase [Candidatus Cloacimonetes bacterium]|nr:DNA primase [Candidatus Cloacimonadota bacterium]